MSDLNPATCTDLEWFEETGMCGGCGSDGDACHPGKPCGDMPTWYDVGRICNRCQYRKDQGLA